MPLQTCMVRWNLTGFGSKQSSYVVQQLMLVREGERESIAYIIIMYIALYGIALKYRYIIYRTTKEKVNITQAIGVLYIQD